MEQETTADGRTYYAPEFVRAVCDASRESGDGYKRIAQRFALKASTVKRWLDGTRRLYYVRQRNQHDRPEYAPE